MYATQTLPEAAKETIHREFDRAESDDLTLLWWNDGNYGKDVAEQACKDAQARLKIADETPLELRTDHVAFVPEIGWFDIDGRCGGVHGQRRFPSTGRTGICRRECYQPNQKHGVAINITPLAEKNIVPDIVEDKVL